MNLILRAIGRIPEMPVGMIVLHLVAKAIGGLGIGILIARYLGASQTAVGWLLVGIAVALGIPVAVRLAGGTSGS
jgi:hypothetical protein